MNYGVAEIEIVTRLNEHFTAKGLDDRFVAVVMPETEEEAKELNKLFPKTTVAVEYVESNYQKPSSLKITKQEETLRFRLLMEGRKKRGQDGLFLIEEEVKLSLIGFRLTHTDELYVSGSGNQQFQSGVWLPYLDFECQSVNVQAFQPLVLPGEEILGGPLVGLITPNDQFLTEFENSMQ